MKRLLLFLTTNAAVLLVMSVVFQAFGLEPWLYQQGVQINLQGLLLFSALFGMGGAFISLAMSKWLAKTSMGVQLIVEPHDDRERWLQQTVARLARTAGIGTPEVGIFPAEAPNAFATGISRDRALVAVSSGLLRHLPPVAGANCGTAIKAVTIMCRSRPGIGARDHPRRQR